jgi:RNA polymerase-binding protein DksA
MRAKERQPFKKLLLERRKMITGDVTHMKDETLSKSRQDASGDISAMPLHMADIGSENYEQEFRIGLVENEEEELREIDEALARIADGSYATCEGCGKSIAKSRLKAIPYARLCISCQREEETQSGQGAFA